MIQKTKSAFSALAACVLLMIATNVAGGGGAAVAKVSAGTAHQALFATSFDGERGIAVGAGGEMQVTTDGGKTWKLEVGPTPLALTAVAIKGSRRLVAGLMGEIFVDDGSGKWHRSTTETKERAMGASINGSGVAMVVGSFGTMLRSADGGTSWQDVAPDWASIFAGSDELTDDFAPSIYAVSMDDSGFGIAVGEMSTVLRTEDGGASWQLALGGAVQGAERPSALFGTTMRPDGVGYAVGQSGLILQTLDRGRTWCSIASGTTANLMGVASFAGGKTLISGMRAMLVSMNDGKSWELVSGGDLAIAWYSGAATAGTDAFIAAGQSGNILRVTQ